MTIPQAFEVALQHHQAGRLGEAEALYRRILSIQPNHAGALHLLGVVSRHVGRNDLAVALIRQSIVFDPRNPAAHYNLAEACRAEGRHKDAVAAYHRALELKPDFPEAQFNLGNTLRERGQLGDAVAAYRRAIELRPDYITAYNNLGVALKDLGQLNEAVATFRRALELAPECSEMRMNLGVALAEYGQSDEAISEYRQALALKSDSPEAHNNLGNALRERGRLDEAVTAFRRALELRPNFPEAHSNLGNALKDQGQLDEAMTAFHRALALKPDLAEAHSDLGNALWERGQLGESIAAFRRALEIKPDYPEAHSNLGNALRDQGKLDEAMASFHRALQLKPHYPEVHANLGIALAGQALPDEAVSAFRYSVQMEPGNAWAHSNLIYSLNFHPGSDGRLISEEQQRWNRQFSDPLKQFIQPHANNRDPERRLRIGYVSPDFRDHPAGRFILPLFECHAQERFQILGYSGTARPDGMTERLRALTVGWRNTVGVADARLAEMIREDGVDILVDLALHTAGNRLLVFARQPAPVQVAWLGYPGSTGLAGIDYRLTDAQLDPPGEKPPWPDEEPVRLPDCWCCYQPPGDSPDINELPALSAENVTFGSLNNFGKVNERVWAIWADILEAVEKSQLLMFCPEGSAQGRVRAFFDARGIGTERVEVVGFLPRREYLRLYQRIDLGLDPFPCNGMTTTCDALWMGVPVLTLPGEMPVSRAGLSILSSVGLAELAASSAEDYVRIAAELAGDLPRLAELRATLRPRMQASPLMDARRFARNVEAAYRAMWAHWCAAGD